MNQITEAIITTARWAVTSGNYRLFKECFLIEETAIIRAFTVRGAIIATKNPYIKGFLTKAGYSHKGLIV